MAKTRKFRLLAGRHHELAQSYNVGEIVPSEYDLVALHGREKFEEVFAMAPVPAVDPVAIQAAVTAGTAEITPPAATCTTPPGMAAPGALGTDVTADFPTADESDLRVFKRGKTYFVARAAMPNDALNEEPLSSKAAVVDCIAELCKPRE
jgi:hypothetical protein